MSEKKNVLHVYGSPSDLKEQSLGLGVAQRILGFTDREYNCSSVNFFDVTLSADRNRGELNSLLSLGWDVGVGGAGLVNLLASAMQGYCKVVIGVPLGKEGYQLSSAVSLLDKAPGSPIGVVPSNASDVAVNLALNIALHDYQIFSDDSKGILNSYNINFSKLCFDDWLNYFKGEILPDYSLIILDIDDPKRLSAYEKVIPSNSIIIAYNDHKFLDENWPVFVESMSGLRKTLFVGNGRIENAFNLAVQVKSIHNSFILDKLINKRNSEKLEKYGSEISRVEDYLLTKGGDIN